MDQQGSQMLVAALMLRMWRDDLLFRWGATT